VGSAAEAPYLATLHVSRSEVALAKHCTIPLLPVCGSCGKAIISINDINLLISVVGVLTERGEVEFV